MKAASTSLWARARHPVAGYAIGPLLTLLAIWPTHRFAVLHLIPFGLLFLAVVVIATVYGLVPALVALAEAVVWRMVFPLPEMPLFPLARIDGMRYLFLVFCAAVVSVIGSLVRRGQNRLQATLAQLRDRNDILVESLQVSRCAAWTFDPAASPSLRWFEGSYPVFGVPFSQVEADGFEQLIHAEDFARIGALRNRMAETTEAVTLEFRVVWPDGEVHWMEMRANPLSSRRWRGVTVDVTERKRAEDALLRTEKLAAMGRLASTVAHEINNPLESVTNLLYLASGSNETREPTQSYLSMAERELARLANITRLTLGFVRNSANVGRVDVATTVEEVMSIFHHRLESKHVTVRRCYLPGVAVEIVPHELRQVVTNLIANSADAFLVAPVLSLSIGAEDDKAVLVVEDNGCGIPSANMPRIFEAFFTTKPEVGTGIGLWVTREIVERNRGRITAESGALAADVVTRFRVELPLAQENGSYSAAESSASLAPKA